MNKLILALVLLSMITAPASAEVRGSVMTVTGGATATFTWDAGNFAGLYYDLDKNLSSETLTATVNDRTIPVNDLIYTVQVVPAEFEVHKSLNLQIQNKDSYGIVGWQGNKYVAIKNKANKIAPLAYEMSSDDKAALTSGTVLNLGAGYQIYIDGVDAKATPRQAFLYLTKDGVQVDSAVVEQKTIYTYTAKVLGESDTLIFATYIDSIFSGAKGDVIQLKYAWLMDSTKAQEIKSSDTYGEMKVTSTGTGGMTLKNDNAIVLSADSEIDIMANVAFKVANDDVTLRFYPKIINEDTTVTTTPTVVNSTVTPRATAPPMGTAGSITSLTPTPTATPISTPQIVIDTPTKPTAPVMTSAPVSPTPQIPPGSTWNGKEWIAPTPVATTPATPGFEAIFAIAGILGVILVVRKRKS